MGFFFFVLIGRKLTDGKYEAPPAHVEGERVRRGYHDDRYGEPDQREAPQQEPDEQADEVEGFAGLSWVGGDCCV